MIFDTPQKIKAYRAIVIKNALTFYAKTGMKVNTAYTPANMLKAAEEITGKKFKRGQYTEAAAELEKFVQEIK